MTICDGKRRPAWLSSDTTIGPRLVSASRYACDASAASTRTAAGRSRRTSRTVVAKKRHGGGAVVVTGTS